LTTPPDPGVAAVRAAELQASLRICGVQHAPIFAPFADCGFLGPGRFESLDASWQQWGGRDRASAYVVDLYRRFRPQVILAHDPVTGEYGHPNHMAAGWACVDAWDSLQCVGDPATPCKIYVRSKDEGAWRPDWDRPEPHFAGRSAAEIGAEALRCHRSQDAASAGVRSWMRYALLRTRVGADQARNDLFEHCPQQG
jgi:LmbE family N-acetylglucosaminyl deacetylase